MKYVRSVPNLEIYSNLNIQVPDIPLVGRETEDSREFLPLCAGKVVLQVEHGLLPVGVGRLGGGGEADSLVTVGELDIEERHECLQSNSVAILNNALVPKLSPECSHFFLSGDGRQTGKESLLS